MSDTPTPAQADEKALDYPKVVWLDRDEETNEKRWFSIAGSGVEYVRADLAALRPEGEAVAEPAIKAAQITMGRGLVDVTRIEHEGRAGILFRPRDLHIPIGDEGELQPGGYWPVNGDVVIWIENEGGAQVIEKYLVPFLPTPPAPAQVEAASLPDPGGVEAVLAQHFNVDRCFFTEEEWIAGEVALRAALATDASPSGETRKPYDTIIKRLLNPPFGTETSERLLMGTAADAIRTLLDEVAVLATPPAKEHRHDD